MEDESHFKLQNHQLKMPWGQHSSSLSIYNILPGKKDKAWWSGTLYFWQLHFLYLDWRHPRGNVFYNQNLSAVSILKIVANVHRCDMFHSKCVVLVIFKMWSEVPLEMLSPSFLQLEEGLGYFLRLTELIRRQSTSSDVGCAILLLISRGILKFWRDLRGGAKTFEEISEWGVKTSAGRVELRELAGRSTTSVAEALLLWVLSSFFLIMTSSMAVLVGHSPVGSFLVQAENT